MMEHSLGKLFPVTISFLGEHDPVISNLLTSPECPEDASLAVTKHHNLDLIKSCCLLESVRIIFIAEDLGPGAKPHSRTHLLNWSAGVSQDHLKMISELCWSVET